MCLNKIIGKKKRKGLDPSVEIDPEAFSLDQWEQNKETCAVPTRITLEHVGFLGAYVLHLALLLTVCVDGRRLLSPSWQKTIGEERRFGRSLKMTDWEFWGSRKSWIAMGVAALSMVVGLVMFMLGHLIWLAAILVGAVVFLAVAYYLVYYENWVLLQQKKGD